ncbi:MAG: CHC2 zinc finger domain-containing protein [Phycisphaeraceae bacterium]
MPIREEVIWQVHQATDLVALIGEQLLLKQKGREYVGLCPFHDDKNPSMCVVPAKQMFHCFVCGTGGNAFGWMMKYHKMTFPEAVKHLAEKAGIEVQDTFDPAQAVAASDRQIIADANAKGSEFFRKLYAHPQQGQIARNYIEKRQISPAMVQAFQIGYAPDGWDGLAKAIAANKWNTRAFELAGLISPRDRGRRAEGQGPRDQTDSDNLQSPGPSPSTLGPSSFYDRLRHRIIFPICDSLGKPIAFGGRKIREEDDPKYWNSPETPLFHKSRTLYGLYLAMKAMKETRTAVIVEGYVDVIACHQAGFANVVATLGTALTREHVGELKKHAEKVVLVFDADVAGQKAADRAMEVFVTEEMDVAIAVVPEGKDPADLMLTPNGPQLWREAITNATDALDYQFERMNEQMNASGTMTGRQRVATEYLRKVASMGIDKAGVIRKAMIQQRLANMLHLSESALVGELKRLTPRRFTPHNRPENRGQGTGDRSQATGNFDSESENWGDAVPQSATGNSQTESLKSPVTTGNPPANTAQTEKSENLGLSDVASLSQAAKIGLIRAERQLLGCLMRQPGLFHATLSDGRTLDEALTPAELCTLEGRELYRMMYDALAEGHDMTLSVLLTDCAQAGLETLAGLATTIEAEIDAMFQTGPGSEADLQGKLTAAAQHIIAHRRQTEYQTAQPEASPNTQAPDDALREVFALQKANRSPLRIMKVDR